MTDKTVSLPSTEIECDIIKGGPEREKRMHHHFTCQLIELGPTLYHILKHYQISDRSTRTIELIRYGYFSESRLYTILNR